MKIVRDYELSFGVQRSSKTEEAEFIKDYEASVIH